MELVVLFIAPALLFFWPRKGGRMPGKDCDGARRVVLALVPGDDGNGRWGGSMLECACAMIASFVLASEFGAVVRYEGEPPFHDLADFRNETEAILNEATRGA